MPLVLCLGQQLARAVEPVRGAVLLERAAERAVAYDQVSLDWTCEETVRLARYDGNEEASRESDQSFALLMRRDSAGQAPVELRVSKPSPAAPSTRRPATMDGFPPITSWMRLFHPELGGFMLFEDRGEDRASNPPRHGFAFRGALPYAEGEDVREWEGTAWLEPTTGDLLAIEAAPRSQAGRLAKLVERRNGRSIGFTFFNVIRFRIGPKAHGRRVEISFGWHDGGFWLPHVTRLETFDAVRPTTTRPLRVVVDSFERCQRFEVDTTQGAIQVPTKPTQP